MRVQLPRERQLRADRHRRQERHAEFRSVSVSVVIAEQSEHCRVPQHAGWLALASLDGGFLHGDGERSVVRAEQQIELLCDVVVAPEPFLAVAAARRSEGGDELMERVDGGRELRALRGEEMRERAGESYMKERNGGNREGGIGD